MKRSAVGGLILPLWEPSLWSSLLWCGFLSDARTKAKELEAKRRKIEFTLIFSYILEQKQGIFSVFWGNKQKEIREG